MQLFVAFFVSLGVELGVVHVWFVNETADWPCHNHGTQATRVRQDKSRLPSLVELRVTRLHGFMPACCVTWNCVEQDFLACGSEAAAKAQGKLRSEGKEYVVRDGDVILFRFNV